MYCIITFASTVHVTSRNFVLLFGQCRLLHCPKGNPLSVIYCNMKCSRENVILRTVASRFPLHFIWITFWQGWAMGMHSFAKESNFLRSFAFFCKRTQRSEFFCVLCKRTVRSLRSFTFFAKERCILHILLRSLQKNVAFFAFFYILKKRMQNNASFFWIS